MLQVDLTNILTEEDALGRIQEIFDHVENSKETYVITKGGRPVFAIVEIGRLEQDQGLLQPAAQTPSTTPPAPVAEPLQVQPAAPIAPEPAPMDEDFAIAPMPYPSVPEPVLPPLPTPDFTEPTLPVAPIESHTEQVAAVQTVTPIEQTRFTEAQPATPVLPPLVAPSLPDMPETDLTNDSPLA